MFECDCDRACNADDPGFSSSSSVSEACSRSLINGDFARFTSFFAPRESDRVREFLLLFESDEDCACGSSSIPMMDVVAVVVEMRENRVALLEPLLNVPVSVDVRESVVRDRRWLFIEPPKKSPMAVPGRAPKRLREITSRPNIAAREREAVGVAGREIELVLNLNKPYWWTGHQVGQIW